MSTRSRVDVETIQSNQDTRAEVHVIKCWYPWGSRMNINALVTWCYELTSMRSFSDVNAIMSWRKQDQELMSKKSKDDQWSEVVSNALKSTWLRTVNLMMRWRNEEMRCDTEELASPQARANIKMINIRHQRDQELKTMISCKDSLLRRWRWWWC